jgi:large subunit ribosomal protein L4
MPTVDVYNIEREKVGQVDLPDAVFGVEVREHLLYAAVRYQRAKARAGTHKVKSRSEVRGGGKKPWRQKGTGRARQGTIRAPQWRGGGVVYGPRVRDHSFKLNKKVRKHALRSALTRRVAEGAAVVLDDFSLSSGKTRDFLAVMARFETAGALILVEARTDALDRASRNVQSSTVLPVDGLNVYDILRHPALILTKSAVEGLVARLGEA